MRLNPKENKKSHIETTSTLHMVLALKTEEKKDFSDEDYVFVEECLGPILSQNNTNTHNAKHTLEEKVVETLEESSAASPVNASLFEIEEVLEVQGSKEVDVRCVREPRALEVTTASENTNATVRVLPNNQIVYKINAFFTECCDFEGQSGNNNPEHCCNII